MAKLRWAGINHVSRLNQGETVKVSKGHYAGSLVRVHYIRERINQVRGTILDGDWKGSQVQLKAEEIMERAD